MNTFDDCWFCISYRNKINLRSSGVLRQCFGFTWFFGGRLVNFGMLMQPMVCSWFLTTRKSVLGITVSILWTLRSDRVVKFSFQVSTLKLVLRMNLITHILVLPNCWVWKNVPYGLLHYVLKGVSCLTNGHKVVAWKVQWSGTSPFKASTLMNQSANTSPKYNSTEHCLEIEEITLATVWIFLGLLVSFYGNIEWRAPLLGYNFGYEDMTSNKAPSTTTSIVTDHTSFPWFSE